MAKYSYFDDFTPKQREMMRKKQISEGQSFKEIIKRFGHPRDWWKNDPGQIKMELK